MEIIKNDGSSDDLPIKNGRETLLRVMLLQLNIGDKLNLPKSEWPRKYPPYKIVAGVKKTHNRTFKYGLKADGTGWLFKRLT